MGFSDVQCRPYKMAKLDAHLSLQEAARVCDVPSLRRILQEEDVDVNGKDKEGYTALYYVIYRGDCSTQASDAMRVLCEHGADVNEQLEALDPLKPTYLFTAMCGYFQGNYMLDVMKTLLQSGRSCLFSQFFFLFLLRERILNLLWIEKLPPGRFFEPTV